MDITKPGQGPEGVTPPEVNPLPAEEPPTAPGETSIPTGVDQPPAGEVPAPIPDEEGSAPLPGGSLTQGETPLDAGLPPDSAVPEGPVLTDTPAPEGAAAPIEASQPQETVIEPDQTPAATLPQEGIEQKIDPAKHETSESLEGAVGGPLTEPTTGAPIESGQTGPGATETPVGLPGQAQEQVPPAPATEPGVADTAPVSPPVEPETPPVSESEARISPEEVRKMVEEIGASLDLIVEKARELGQGVQDIENSVSGLRDKLSEVSNPENPEAKGGERG